MHEHDYDSHIDRLNHTARKLRQAEDLIAAIDLAEEPYEVQSAIPPTLRSIRQTKTAIQKLTTTLTHQVNLFNA